VDPSRTELGIIEEIVRRETRFLRHYAGKVLDNQDPLGKGRVLVAIMELGHSSEDEGPWAWPRYRGGQVTPEKGEHVEVYFMAGDPGRPVYIGKMAEMKDSEVRGYEGPHTRVLFSDETEDMQIVYDEEGKVLKIIGADSGAVVEVTSSGATIEVTGTGAIKVTPAAGQNVVLNNGVQNCNNLPSCIMTGAPHGTNPQVKV